MQIGEEGEYLGRIGEDLVEVKIRDMEQHVYQASAVLSRRYRLDRSRNKRGRLVFDLREKELVR